MKLKHNLLAAAAMLALTAGSASAAVNQIGASSSGNGSVLFVAIDANNNTALTVDLGLNMSDFVPGATRTGLGTSITWSFNDNLVNDASITGNSWSSAFNTFLGAQSGGDFRWGVIAADSISGNVSGSNTLQGRGFLATGNPTTEQMLNANTGVPTGSALTVINTYYGSVASLGTLTSANNGAAVTDSSSANGNAYLGTTMGDRFSGNLTWSYLVDNGVTSSFQYQRQVVANPDVFQIGDPSSLNSTIAADQPNGTFSFDLATGDLQWQVTAAVAAVPEPETYAMMLAGLAAVGAMARRRRNQAKR